MNISFLIFLGCKEQYITVIIFTGASNFQVSEKRQLTKYPNNVIILINDQISLPILSRVEDEKSINHLFIFRSFFLSLSHTRIRSTLFFARYRPTLDPSLIIPKISNVISIVGLIFLPFLNNNDNALNYFVFLTRTKKNGRQVITRRQTFIVSMKKKKRRQNYEITQFSCRLRQQRR